MNAIDKKTIRYVLQSAIKIPSLFSQLCTKVRDKCFKADELFEHMIWAIYVKYYERFKELPNQQTAKMLAYQIRTEKEYGFPDDYINEFFQELDALEPNEMLAIEYANAWLATRIVGQKLLTTLTEKPTDFANAVQQCSTEVGDLQISQTTIDPIFNENLFSGSKKHSIYVPTGIPFIDEELDGGYERKEIALLLGATGVGKTTLAIQQACGIASNLMLENKDGRVVFVTFEFPAIELKYRIISYLASIPYKRLKEITGEDELSKIPRYHDYEKSEWFDNLPSEYDRFQQAKWIDKYMTVIGLSGISGEAIGGVHDIANKIRQLNTEIHFVVADWLGAMVERSLRNKYTRDERSAEIIELNRAPSKFIDFIAIPFNTPVLLVHQLRGGVLDKSFTYKFSHADAAGCKSLANLCGINMILGTKDTKYGIVVFRFTKRRRSIATSEPRLLIMKGGFFRFMDATEEYAIDLLTGEVEEKRNRIRMAARRGTDAVRNFTTFNSN